MFKTSFFSQGCAWGEIRQGMMMGRRENGVLGFNSLLGPVTVSDNNENDDEQGSMSILEMRRLKLREVQ